MFGWGFGVYVFIGVMVEGFIFEFVGIGFGCCGYGCVGDLVVFGFVVVVDDFVFIDC